MRNCNGIVINLLQVNWHVDTLSSQLLSGTKLGLRLLQKTITYAIRTDRSECRNNYLDDLGIRSLKEHGGESIIFNDRVMSD